MKTENLDRLAKLAIHLDNLHHATKIPMPDSLHMEGLKPALPEMRDELKEIFYDEGGEKEFGRILEV